MLYRNLLKGVDRLNTRLYTVKHDPPIKIKPTYQFGNPNYIFLLGTYGGPIQRQMIELQAGMREDIVKRMNGQSKTYSYIGYSTNINYRACDYTHAEILSSTLRRCNNLNCISAKQENILNTFGFKGTLKFEYSSTGSVITLICSHDNTTPRNGVSKIINKFIINPQFLHMIYGIVETNRRCHTISCESILTTDSWISVNHAIYNSGTTDIITSSKSLNQTSTFQDDMEYYTRFHPVDRATRYGHIFIHKCQHQ